MTVFITLTTAGTDSGPFALFSDVDGFLYPFESGISKSALLAGYSSSLVPDFTTIVRVKSNGTLCTNYIDIPVEYTTTSTSSTTTTTTTAAPPQEAKISSASDPSNACALTMPNTCWVGGGGDISTGDIVYTDALGTTPFVGDGNFYKIQILIYPDAYSVQVSGTGTIEASLGGVCP